MKDKQRTNRKLTTVCITTALIMLCTQARGYRLGGGDSGSHQGGAVGLIMGGAVGLIMGGDRVSNKQTSCDCTSGYYHCCCCCLHRKSSVGVVGGRGVYRAYPVWLPITSRITRAVHIELVVRMRRCEREGGGVGVIITPGSHNDH